jgi:hypothetical protein
MKSATYKNGVFRGSSIDWYLSNFGPVKLELIVQPGMKFSGGPLNSFKLSSSTFCQFSSVFKLMCMNGDDAAVSA